jgi:hypothetical protein
VQVGVERLSTGAILFECAYPYCIKVPVLKEIFHLECLWLSRTIGALMERFVRAA